MESFKVENLSFMYPEKEQKALDDVTFSVFKGEFVTLCGKSGCGKTTLLRLLKPSLAPFGELEGNIYFEKKPVGDYDVRAEASKIGFVMQSPDNQIVTDKVWHELAFGLESLGYSTPEIRKRVAEMATFFGIEEWFHKKVTMLSGGQKQLLNLAAVMVMNPSVLILDEPTSQLDPIAAGEFLKTIEKINREMGVTIILSEHRLEDAFPMSDRVIVMDKGKIIADDTPKKVGEELKRIKHDMYDALPTPIKVYSEIENGGVSPLTVREGRIWLEEYAERNKINPMLISQTKRMEAENKAIIELKDVWFRYSKNEPDVIRGMNAKIFEGEIFAFLGGNGAGKTTTLSLINGINKPYRGDVVIEGRSVIKGWYHDGLMISMLPQNPQSVFVKKTVFLDLWEMVSESKISQEEKEEKVSYVASLCGIEKLLDCHPYDLSGGEQQRAALAKVLLTEPKILLLDEPTKGMDAHFKKEFADILNDLKEKSVTVVMVSHDVEFCAEYADRCALVFDGDITSLSVPREFFKGNSFYTTTANRMARGVIPEAIVADDIIKACGGEVKKRERKKRETEMPCIKEDADKSERRKRFPFRMTAGIVFAAIFILTSIFYACGMFDATLLKVSGVVEIILAFLCLFPKKDLGVKKIRMHESDSRLTKRTIVAAFLILLAIPVTIYAGMHYFGDRKYYFTSLLIILETIIPFCMVFEKRRPKAREMVIISVLCAIAVAGRAVFFMIPEFKPVVALVIIAGVCFGGETGFLVGAVTGFVSNFFFGQGPWTPWQMFAFGIIGFVSGVIFKKNVLRKTKVTLCIFGFLATVLIYGGIMNPASVIMWQNEITKEMILSSYVVGLPMDLVHSVSTGFFLWFIAEPMIEKLERVKIKYGLIEK